MRFLHTADWHVGKTLKGQSRLEEHEAALQEILSIAMEERVDAVLIAGDTFDSQAPSPEAERLVYAFLAECCGTGIPVVLIGGNHDHPKKLAALTRLLDHLRIYVRAEPCRPEAGGVIELGSRDGREQARIAVIPFVPERRIVDACQLMGPDEEWYQEYASRVAKMVHVLARSFAPHTVNVVLAHLLIDGARVGGGERQLHLGQVYAVSPQMLPPNAHYIGLGHLHRPQAVLAASPTCFAGSILQLDFGEREQEKRVVLVQAHPGRPAEIRSIPLTSGRPLLDVAGTVDELRARADSLRSAYLRVTVEAEAPTPGLAEKVRSILPNALDIQLDYPRKEEALPVTSGLARLQPMELFREFYRQRHGAELPVPLAALFERLYEEALNAAR